MGSLRQEEPLGDAAAVQGFTGTEKPDRTPSAPHCHPSRSGGDLVQGEGWELLSTSSKVAKPPCPVRTLLPQCDNTDTPDASC